MYSELSLRIKATSYGLQSMSKACLLKEKMEKKPQVNSEHFKI